MSAREKKEPARTAAADLSVLYLIVTSDREEGDRAYPLVEPLVTIGRALDRDIVLADRCASSHHAEVQRVGARWVIRDLGSTNGTFVNGTRVNEALLSLGDQITVGSTTIVLHDNITYEKTSKILLGPAPAASAAQAGALAPPAGAASAFSGPANGGGTAQAARSAAGHDPHPGGLTRGLIEYPLVDIEKRFFQSLDEKSPPDVAQKLASIHRLSSELNSILEADPLLERVADLIIEVIACDRVFIVLSNGGKLVPKVIRKKAGLKDHKGLSISSTILNQVLREGVAIITQDAQDDKRFAGGDSIAFYSIRSALSVPLKAKEAVLGVVHVDKTTANQPFKEQDLQLLALICDHAASILVNAQLFAELRAANAELRAAKEEILRWNLELEQKVEERTREIARKSEEILRLNEQKDELLGMVAHDLRTPITAILGFMDVIVQHIDAGAEIGRIREDVEIVQRIATEMSDLLNDLLDVSKIEAGKITIQRELRSLRPLIEECYATYRFLAEPKGLALKLEIPDGDEIPPVRHDPRRISQILNNLLSNAVKFSRAGDTITLSANRVGNWIVVSVTDTGQGIAPEEIHKIFQRFEQTSTAPTSGERGTGLGLAIAKKLVELHGGKIWVESKPGVGSKFAFSLPL